MAISGKPPKPAPTAEPVKSPSEQEVFNLINKGGSVAKVEVSEDAPASLKPMLVQLRLYPDMVGEIDAVRMRASGKGRRPRPLSRHAWIVNAIEEKIARDSSEA